MMECKSSCQCKALFGLRIQLAIYRSNAASARVTFCHDKKNQAMEHIKQSSLKKSDYYRTDEKLTEKG